MTRVPDGAVRAAVLEDAFVPPRPKEWKTNPSEWLTSEDIDKVLRQYAEACPHFHYTGFGFIDFAADVRVPQAARGGPFQPVKGGRGVDGGSDDGDVISVGGAPDSVRSEHCVMPALCSLNLSDLAAKGVTLVASVLNLSRHVEEGTHWVFVLIFIPGAQMVYFDSNADATPPEILRWHRKLARTVPDGGHGSGHGGLTFRRNNVVRQATDTECGMFALYSIVSIVRGRWLEGDYDDGGHSCGDAAVVPRMLDELLDAETPLTDELVAKYRHILFGPSRSPER